VIWLGLPVAFPYVVAAPTSPHVRRFESLTAFATIFASDEEEAKEVAAQVDRAADLYRQCFGAEPDRGEIIILDTPAATGSSPLPASDKPAWTYSHFGYKCLRILMGKTVARLKESDLEAFGYDSREELLDSFIESSTEIGVAGHEVGHYLLDLWLRRTRKDEKTSKEEVFTAYGTPLPDWMDEGFAIRCETQEGRNRRVIAYRDNKSARIPLAELLYKPYVALNGNATNSRTIREEAKSGGNFTLSVPNGQSRDFYGSVAAFMAYLEEKGKLAIYREWAEFSRDNPSASPRIFLARQKILPSLLSLLQSDFDAWIETVTLE
jgi:hypothetical protein